MKMFKVGHIRKIIIISTLTFILTSCSSSTRYPDDMEFMMKKYPEIRQHVESFEDENLNPSQIDIKKDLEKEFPDFRQWDKRWAFLEYNDSIMAKEGNIPTAMASIYCHFTKDEEMNPHRLGQYFEKNLWAVKNVGTTWNAIEKGSYHLGLKYQVLASNKQDIDTALSQNRVLLASVGKGDFTQDSGLIIIYLKMGNAYKISDPLSEKNSNRYWSFDELDKQIIHLWSFSKM